MERMSLLKWSAFGALVLMAMVAFTVSKPKLVRAAAAQSSTPTPITKATISPVIPTEVVDGNGAPVPVAVSSLPIDFFDDFSWRTFLALNWPAKPDTRGEADTTKSVTDPGPARVWETWKADYEAFQPGGTPPTEWPSFDAVTPCIDIPFKDGGKARVLAAFSKFGNLNEASFGFPGNPFSSSEPHLHTL